ncbi:MAG: type II toxin-antitoxin system HicA family toxin [Prevotellaceae bacterium]|nr:type II toxin-antitoxin system HicA family toxin [Prevotella sp.]MDD7272846.1 type II toxin-antitoxin system HicA family toxin [Prevotellaceae bacterium]
MKYNQLFRELKKAGCQVTKHGSEHDEWTNPVNGAKIRIGRHGSQEVKKGMLIKIYKVLLGI